MRVETLPPPESLFLFTINLHYFTFSLLARGPEEKKERATVRGLSHFLGFLK